MATIWMDVDAALSEVPVNTVPLTSSADFITVDETIAYNESGMMLYWNFTTTAGVTTVTNVTPTSGGDYDWNHQDFGIYTLEIPATGGASINNDTEGFGYFTGQCDGVLAWRGPTIGFRAAALNNALIDGGDVLDANVTAMANGVQTKLSYDQTTAFVTEQEDAGASTIFREGSDGSTHTGATLASQIGSIGGGTGSAQTQPAEGVTINTGSETTNTYVATELEDGVYHGVTEVGGVLDFAYSANISSSSNGRTVSIRGRLNEGSPPPGGDSVDVQAWRYDTDVFEVILSDAFPGISGSGPDDDTTVDVDLLARHTDTNGDFLIGISGTALETGTEFLTDRFGVGFDEIGAATGYEGGSFWVRAAGESGTVWRTNGIAENPCPFADAMTMNATHPLNRLTVASQTAIEFVVDMTGFIIEGNNYSIDFSDENSDALLIRGATVSGLLTSSGAPGLIQCRLTDGATLPSGGYEKCTHPGNINLPGSFYLFDGSRSVVAGLDAPSVTLTGGVQDISFREISGGMELINMDADKTFTFEGNGQIVIAAGGTGGTIAVRGNFTVSGDQTAIDAITWAEDARFDSMRIRVSIGLAAANLDTQLGDIPNNSEFEARTIVSADYGLEATNQLIVEDTGTTLPAQITSVHGVTDGKVDAVKAETVLIVEDTGTTLPAQITSVHGVTDGKVDAVKAETVLIVEDTGTTLPAQITSEHAATDALIGAIPTNPNTVVPLEASVDQANSDAITVVTAKLDSTLELDGAGPDYQFTTEALENAPGGTSSITITPFASETDKGGKQNFIKLTAYQHAVFNEVYFAVYDSSKPRQPVDLSGINLTWVAWDKADPDTILISMTTGEGKIEVNGVDDNQVNLLGDTTDTAIAYQSLQWKLIGTDDDTQYAYGFIDVNPSAQT